MRFEEGFYKLKPREQEVLLIRKMEELQKIEDRIRKLLGIIRGGGILVEPKK